MQPEPDRTDVTTAARWAGWSLLAITASLLIAHGGSMIVAGQRVTGTSDFQLIQEFYSYRELLPLYWQHGLGVVIFGGFIIGFHRFMRDQATKTIDRLLLATGVIAAASVIPLALTELGLQAALVQLSDTQASEAILGVFASWDWIYNSFFYWLEAVWVGAFSLLLLRTQALPRWIAVLGLVVASLHVFHSAVLMLGLPDAVTLPGTALFLVWFIATGIQLVRWGR